MQTNSKNNIILSVVIVLAFIGGVAFLFTKSPIGGGGIVCTMEAKQCPDGSYVGRGGPKCEFATCPGAADTSTWQTSNGAASGVSFKYPTNISTTYIKTVDWPPAVQVISGAFACTDAGEEVARAGKTENKTINGRAYCVTTVSEGAAGSTYTQYAYARAFGTKTLYFTFTLRFPQCGNYNDPQKTACESERTLFDINNLLDQIIQTAQLL